MDPAVETKVVNVGPREDVGGPKAGILAFRMTTQKAGGSTVSWQEDTGSAIVRHKELDMSGLNHFEEYYTPHKLRVDESPARTTAGAAWTETYTESSTNLMTGEATTSAKTEQWSVVAVDEVVTVPAGTFCTLRIRRVSMTGGLGGSDKTFWFARGVGKVKETGGQTEELVSFSIP